MTAIIKNHFEKVYELQKTIKGYDYTEEFSEEITKAIISTLQNVIHFVKTTTQIFSDEVKFSTLCDYNQQFNGCYHPKENEPALIEINIARFLENALTQLSDGQSSEYVSKFIHLTFAMVVLHELGHHISLKKRISDTTYVDKGMQVFNYVEDFGSKINFRKLASSEIFIQLLYLAQKEIIDEEFFADSYAEAIIKAHYSNELFEFYQKNKMLEKKVSYYWMYAEEFIETLVGVLIKVLLPNQEEYKYSFINDLILKTKVLYEKDYGLVA